MKQNVTIKIKGLSTAPSNIAQEDGELAVCHNLVSQQGEIVPAFQPTAVKNICRSVRVLYIHKTTDGEIYIWRFLGNNKIGWSIKEGDIAEEEWTNLEINVSETDDDPEIKSIGNILIVSSVDYTYYYRWISGTYKFISNKQMPDLPVISFTLGIIDGDNNTYAQVGLLDGFFPDLSDTINATAVDTSVKHEFSNCFSTEELIGISDDAQLQSFYDYASGEVVKFHNYVSKIGAFDSPFMIRYAFRMYDGTLSKLSAPVLIVPNSSINASAGYTDYDATNDTVEILVKARRYISYLYYRVSTSDDFTNWEEIIQSVEFFVSSPLYTYDYADYDDWKNNLKKWRKTGTNTSAYVVAARSSSTMNNCSTGYRIGKTIGDAADAAMDILPSQALFTDNAQDLSYFLQLKEYTSEEMSENVINTSSFYLVCSIPIDEIVSSDAYKKLPIKSNVLNTLETRESMSDDYLTNYSIAKGSSFVYNRRLLRFDCERDYSSNLNLSTLIEYGYAEGNEQVEMYVHLKKGGETLTVYLGKSYINQIWYTHWICYPDPDAYELIFIIPDSNKTKYGLKIPLTKHKFLNAAYWINDGAEKKLGTIELNDSSIFSGGTFDEDINCTRKQMSTIYVSEVDNPFLFPSGLSCTCGNGNVIALAATTLPISEGQQGQFPVMAFTDEGIWPLNIGSTGSITSTNPMLRDVLSDKKSICVMDDAVAYATSRGIKILSGKESICISDELKGEFLNTTDLSSFDDVSGITARPNSGSSLEWSAGSRIMYSQQLQRLYVVPNASWASKTALVYSLDAQAWSSIDWEYTDPVNNYPTTLVQKIGNSSTDLYDIGVENYDAGAPTAAILTRPLALTQATELKTVDDIILYGNVSTPKFSTTETTSTAEGVDKEYTPVENSEGYHTIVENSSDISMILYGSDTPMDISSWRIINSSTTQYLHGRCGSPYKYFRLAVFSNTLTRGKSILCGVATVDSKYTNKIR